MKSSEALKLIVEGLRKAEMKLHESEQFQPPYLANITSVRLLAEATADLSAELEELKQTLVDHRYITK